jgi:hypothetical protein
MERLTIPDIKIEGGTRRAVIDAMAVKKEAMTIYWALKKYEDLELTPAQIRGIDKLYAEKCREVAALQRELKNSVKLPCKVGDTVYLISSPVNVTNYENEEPDDETLMIFECKILSITFYETSNQIRLYWNGEFVGYYLTTEHIGKIIFLTRDAAEKALSEVKE